VFLFVLIAELKFLATKWTFDHIRLTSARNLMLTCY